MKIKVRDRVVGQQGDFKTQSHLEEKKKERTREVGMIHRRKKKRFNLNRVQLLRRFQEILATQKGKTKAIREVKGVEEVEEEKEEEEKEEEEEEDKKEEKATKSTGNKCLILPRNDS